MCEYVGVARGLSNTYLVFTLLLAFTAMAISVISIVCMILSINNEGMVSNERVER